MINKHENEKCGNVYTHTGFSLKPFDSKGFRFQRKFRLKEFSTLIIYRFPLLIDKKSPDCHRFLAELHPRAKRACGRSSIAKEMW